MPASAVIACTGLAPGCSTGPSTPLGSVGPDLTIEFWVALGPGLGLSFLAGNSDAANTQGYAAQAQATGRPGLRYRDATATRVAPTGTGDVFDRRWHHLAMTKSGVVCTTYLDGGVYASGTVAGTPGIVATTGAFGIGRAATATNAPGGMYAEFRLWNVARTQAQVLALKDLRAAGTESGLVAYWPLNEGTGNTLIDKVGGVALSLNESVWVTPTLAPLPDTPAPPDGGGGTPTLVAQTDRTGRSLWRQPAAWYVCTVTGYGLEQPSVFLAASHWLPAVGHALCLGTGDAVRATVSLQYGKQEVRPPTGAADALELNVAPDVACHIEAWQLL